MQAGMIGLERMSANREYRWMVDGHDIAVLGWSYEKKQHLYRLEFPERSHIPNLLLWLEIREWYGS